MFDIYIKGTCMGVDSLIPTKGYAISQDGTKVLVAIKKRWMDDKNQKCDVFQWWPLEMTAPFLHND